MIRTKWSCIGLGFVLVASFLDAQSNAPARSKSGSESVKAESVTINMPESMTKDQADEMLKELKAIHQLLDRQVAAAARPQAAPVNDKVFTELKKNYIDTGKVRFVSRDLPLDFHPNAPGAAVAAHCAGEQDKFWELRDLMVANSADLSQDSLLKYGEKVSLDMPAFRACLSDKKYSAAIQKDVADAGTLGISGTPSFVLGKTAKDQINGVRIVGAVPYSVFETAIKNQLNATP